MTSIPPSPDAALAAIAVDDALPPLRSEITLASIRAFGEATLDFNALHFDAQAAQAEGVAGMGVIAHGMSTFALMTRLLTDWLAPRGGVHRRLETRWLRPARPGDVLTASAVVSAKHRTSHGRWVEFDLKVHNARDELIATGEALAQFAPAPHRH